MFEDFNKVQCRLIGNLLNQSGGLCLGLSSRFFLCLFVSLCLSVHLSIGTLPSTFDTTLTIDMIFGTYNEFPLYFQLSITTWYLTGFHDNHSYINDVTSSGNHVTYEITAIKYK